MFKKLEKYQINGNIVASVTGYQVDASDPENIVVLETANIDGSNTVGGVWFIDRILSDRLSGSTQVLNALTNNTIEWGNIELDKHIFLVDDVNGVKVKLGSAEGTIWNSFNLTNVSQLNNDAGYLQANDLDGYVYDVQYNSSTHEITFYLQNEPNIVIDLPIEQLITGVELVGNDLVFTFEDGSVVTVPMNTLLVGVVKKVNGLTPNSQGEVVINIADIPGLSTELNKIGALTTLTTTDKSSLVNAINEVNGNVPNVTGFIPYTGANQPINFNTQQLTSGTQFLNNIKSFSISSHHLGANTNIPGYFKINLTPNAFFGTTFNLTISGSYNSNQDYGIVQVSGFLNPGTTTTSQDFIFHTVKGFTGGLTINNRGFYIEPKQYIDENGIYYIKAWKRPSHNIHIYVEGSIRVGNSDANYEPNIEFVEDATPVTLYNKPNYLTENQGRYLSNTISDSGYTELFSGDLNTLPNGSYVQAIGGASTNGASGIGVPRSLISFGARNSNDSILQSDILVGTEGFAVRNRTNNIWRTAWHSGNLLQSSIDNWNTAFGWGNHALAGYLTSATANYLTINNSSSSVPNGAGLNTSGAFNPDTIVGSVSTYTSTTAGTPFSTGFILTQFETSSGNTTFQLGNRGDVIAYRGKVSGSFGSWLTVASREWVNSQGFSTQTLTAGDNISIVDNVISATDTTYSAGTGLALNGTEFSQEITYLGAGSFVTQVVQNENGLTVILGEPTNTITRIRANSNGTYATGQITLLPGNNVSLTQSGGNITINAVDTNTTYNAGTLALLQAGTNTSNRVWSPKILADGVIRKGVNNVNPEGEPFSIHANYGTLDWNGNGFSFVTDTEQEFTYIEDEQAIGVNPFQDYGFYLSGQRLRFTSIGVSSELLPTSGGSKSKLPTTGSTQRTLAVGATMGGSTYYANENGLIGLPNTVVDTTVKLYMPGEVVNNDTVNCNASKTIVYLSDTFTGPLTIDIDPDLQDGAELIVIHTYGGGDTGLFNINGAFISHVGQLISTYPASQGKTYRFIHVKDLQRFALVAVGQI